MKIEQAKSKTLYHYLTAFNEGNSTSARHTLMAFDECTTKCRIRMDGGFLQNSSIYNPLYEQRGCMFFNVGKSGFFIKALSVRYYVPRHDINLFWALHTFGADIINK